MASNRPVQYSASARKGAAQIGRQMKLAIEHLPSSASRRRPTELARIVAYSVALQLLAEEHNQWDVAAAFDAARAPYARELSDFEMGIAREVTA